MITKSPQLGNLMTIKVLKKLVIRKGTWKMMSRQHLRILMNPMKSNLRVGRHIQTLFQGAFLDNFEEALDSNITGAFVFSGTNEIM